jgi:hypothetical protein
MLWVSNKEKLRRFANMVLEDFDRMIKHVRTIETKVVLSERKMNEKLLRLEQRIATLETARPEIYPEMIGKSYDGE